ncbi:hypothetical protein LU11_gp044 [Pseudomonas phage Lu11]|uniref:hypothetical protein n=1 Tax=Pseudomonas phage Lu11 TaxID=1161927 RepID=UPI00025F1506|nr:hypothetical protein LU11_gp044 [Pseudomonas phage Lu11]AFH14575.1 hypothetical protein Lu11_0044 [Pseudomonas phage Lu11]
MRALRFLVVVSIVVFVAVSLFVAFRLSREAYAMGAWMFEHGMQVHLAGFVALMLSLALLLVSVTWQSIKALLIFRRNVNDTGTVQRHHPG